MMGIYMDYLVVHFFLLQKHLKCLTDFKETLVNVWCLKVVTHFFSKNVINPSLQ